MYVCPVVGSVVVLSIGNDFVALSINRALTVSGVNVGSAWIIRAAAPLTTGVAMLVPLNRMYAGERVEFLVLVIYSEVKTSTAVYFFGSCEYGESSETTELPGAMRSGFTTWSKAVGPFEL
jgi:hypothetical protein